MNCLWWSLGVVLLVLRVRCLAGQKERVGCSGSLQDLPHVDPLALFGFFFLSLSSDFSCLARLYYSEAYNGYLPLSYTLKNIVSRLQHFVW